MRRSYDGFIIHTGENDVSIHYPNSAFVYSDLRQTFGNNEKITVEFKSRMKPRNLSQNNLFHAYCGIIADETGNSLEAVKSTLKAMFAKRPFLDKDGEEVYNKETGEALTYIQDTRDMSTIQMFELTENTRLFAMEWFGIYLALPEEQQTFKFKNK